MEDLGVVDRFLNVFTRYIDSGFGLLGGEVAWLTAVLVAIDITLVGLFWAMGGAGDDIIGKLLKKALYVGAFALILGNFNELSTIVFQSFAGLGLTASGATLSAGELLRPGRLASVGVDAGRPLLDQIGDLAGFPEIFVNLDSIVVLLLAWLVVIVCFFILSVQLFVTLIEFKLTTLAGFVLIPFALWNKTAFLAEKVLGNVVSSGIKILVLAVIVGIGTGIFGEFTTPPGTDLTIDHALAIMLASLAMFGLGLFGPSIATGLVSGGPQLGAGAAAGAALAVGGIGVAGAATVAGGTRLAGAASGSVLRASGSAAVAGYQAAKAGADAFNLGAAASGAANTRAAAAGLGNVARVGANAAGARLRSAAARTGAAARERAGLGTNRSASSEEAPSHSSSDEPAWARHMRHRQTVGHGISTTAHVLRSADHGSSGAGPSLRGES